MHKMLSSIINKFDAEAKNHMERQSLNPFSGSFSRSPSPRLSKDQYGKPLAGSKTEERGHKAKCHILREILDLCNCIHDLGVYNKQHKPNEDSDDEETHDDEIIITFGEIFQMYTKINDKVVGLLIAAKKRGFLYFEKEILFQRRDDDVLIALIKPISEIRATINKELVLPSPVPFSSRNVSPTASSDSEAEKSNGNVESNKSSSGSPVQQVKNAGSDSPRAIGNNVPSENKEVDKPVVVKANEGTSVESNVPLVTAEVEKSENSDKVEEKPCVSEANAVSSLPSVAKENTEAPPQTSDEGVKTEKEEITVLAEEIPAIPQQNEECVVSKVEIICETGSTDNNNDDSPLPNEPVQSPPELIPTIEISEAITPVQGRSREPSLVMSTEDNAEKTANEEISTNEIGAAVEPDVTDVKISADGIENINVPNVDVPNTDVPMESNENTMEVPLLLPEASPTPEDVAISAEGIKNIDLSPDSYVSVTEMSQTSPDTFHIAEETVATDMDEPIKTEESVIQTFDKPYDILLPCTTVNDNERKRTFSNEELIESLTAALSARSSSPDPCDEEVEQIFRSQTAVSSLLNETTTNELATIQETFSETHVTAVASTCESASDNVDCTLKSTEEQSSPENNEPIQKTDTDIVQTVPDNQLNDQENTPEPTTETAVNTLKTLTETDAPVIGADIKASE